MTARMRRCSDRWSVETSAGIALPLNRLEFLRCRLRLAERKIGACNLSTGARIVGIHGQNTRSRANTARVFCPASSAARAKQKIVVDLAGTRFDSGGLQQLICIGTPCRLPSSPLALSVSASANTLADCDVECQSPERQPPFDNQFLDPVDSHHSPAAF
jgi:hypothetical protein